MAENHSGDLETESEDGGVPLFGPDVNAMEDGVDNSPPSTAPSQTESQYPWSSHPLQETILPLPPVSTPPVPSVEHVEEGGSSVHPFDFNAYLATYTSGNDIPDFLMPGSSTGLVHINPTLNPIENDDIQVTGQGAVPMTQDWPVIDPLEDDVDSLQDIEEDYTPNLPKSKKNFGTEDFLGYWKRMYLLRKPDYPPISALAETPQQVKKLDKITPEDVKKAGHDIQGIYWSRFQTTKEMAREVRRMTLINFTNNSYPEWEIEDVARATFGTKAFKASFKSTQSPAISSSQSYFKFRQTNPKCQSESAHYQLQHNISAASRNAVFYQRSKCPYNNTHPLTARPHWGIFCFNPQTGSVEMAMDLSKVHDKDAERVEFVSTIAAGDGVLVAGAMEGVYALKSLAARPEDAYTSGKIVTDNRFILDSSTNHVHTHLDRRSGLPYAVFCSNDRYIRTLDCYANKWIRYHKFEHPVNCSATSPDGRLRILVSDERWARVCDAETGEMLAALGGHKDHGFACAWSPDGLTMATAHQDGIVQIWDARNMSTAITSFVKENERAKAKHSIPAECGGVRALQFSPLGAGRPVLVMAEPDDFVNVVDAVTWEGKQTIDFFGGITGVSMPPDGSVLYVGNEDRKYGGIMEFERKGAGGGEWRWSMPRRRGEGDGDEEGEGEGAGEGEGGVWRDTSGAREGFSASDGPVGDWLDDEELDWHPKCLLTRRQRWRRYLDDGGLSL